MPVMDYENCLKRDPFQNRSAMGVAQLIAAKSEKSTARIPALPLLSTPITPIDASIRPG